VQEIECGERTYCQRMLFLAHDYCTAGSVSEIGGERSGKMDGHADQVGRVAFSDIFSSDREHQR